MSLKRLSDGIFYFLRHPGCLCQNARECTILQSRGEYTGNDSSRTGQSRPVSAASGYAEPNVSRIAFSATPDARWLYLSVTLMLEWPSMVCMTRIGTLCMVSQLAQV